MEALRWQLFDAYGSRARIIRAERVRTGGLFGVGASTSFEVTVEVDGPPAGERARRRHAAPSGGLADLLAGADGADSAAPSSGTVVSTRKPDFDAILGRMAEGIGDAAGASAGRDTMGGSGVPQLFAGAGDLILLVGLRGQPLHVAWRMAGTMDRGAELRTAGEHRSNGVGHVLVDSAEVKKAQALAAVDGKPLVVAHSLGARGSSSPSALASVRADQLWLVVDAAHKPEDTLAWVRQVGWYAAPDALAVLGTADTATPETVNGLGFPVGWVGGYPATSPVI